MKTRLLALVAIFAMSLSISFGQKSIGGTPEGITNNLSVTHVPTQQLAPLNLIKLKKEDAEDDKLGTWPRIAKTQQTNLTLQNSGDWTTLPNGDRIWRQKVKGVAAKGLIFSFSNFYLPPGAKLFVYSPDGNYVSGAFTFANNKPSGYFATTTTGNEAIVEYYEPALVQGQGHFTINEVGQVYRTVGVDGVAERDFGDSDPCQVNVNCSPEGDNWQDQKRGVARILLKDGANWGWCSGSLVNNTAQDCYPYFLTAHHCGETASAADQAQWFFYFNYESSNCSNGTNPVPNAFSPPAGSPTTQGCSFVSHANDGGGASGSDYKLVDLINLSSTDITNWNLYFNGWDASGTGSSSGVSIHHPSGDIKKISTYTTNLTTTQWNGNGLPSHWLVQWSSTTNGWGVTEGGSSGSPIFNNSGLIIGTLTGGSSYCTAQTSPDMYGKMSYHWDQNSNPFGGHLEVWLDPVGSGSNTTVTGTYAPCSPTAPNCAFTASPNPQVVGGTVNFTDNSTGVPTSWAWDFGDGVGTSTQQNPSYVYTAPGTYTVELIATNAYGSCTTTVAVVINPSTGCDTINFPPPGTLTVYSGGNGYVAGWNTQYQDVSKAELISGYAPYTHVTGMLVYLFGVVDGGAGATVDFNIWDNTGTAGSPGAILGTVSVPLSQLETALGGPGGQGLIQVFFNNPVNVGGADYYSGITMNGFGANDSLGIVSNTDGDSNPATAWEEWSGGGGWYAFDDASSWGLQIGLFISPYMTDAPPTAGLTASVTNICEGDAITFDGSTSVNYDSLEWVFVGGTPNTGTNVSETITYNTAGTYTAYLQAYGSCGGYSLDSIANISVNAAPTISATATDETCSNADGTITATGSGGSGTGYQYSIDNGTTWQASGSFTGLATGTYVVLIEDSNGCQGSTSITVGQNLTGPTPTGTTTDENCGNSDGSITITASGATQYSIDGITYQASNVFNGLPAGTYTIYAMDGSGCVGSNTVTISASSPTITVSSSSTDENCSAGDGTITLSATGGTSPYQYSIDGGTTFQASGSFTGLSAGTYNIVVEDANGCQGTDVVTIINAGGPTITNVAVTDVTCNGASDGIITITASGGTLTYSIDGSTYQSSNTFPGLAAGTYTVYVDNGACITTDGPHTINEPTAVTHTATVTDAGCTNDGQIDVVAAGGSGSFQYSIDGGATYQASGTFTALAPGTYQVIAIDANGCTSTLSTETVGSLPALVASATGADETCVSGNGSISINATGGDGNYQYSIDGGVIYQASGTFTGLSSGTYNISVIDGSGCSDTDVITINNTGGVNVTTSGNQTICAGNSANLTASGATNYNWYDGATLVGTGSSISVPPSNTTTYTVIGDDGTCSDTSSVTVTVNSIPTTTVTGDTSICQGETAVLTASGGSSYFWAHSGETAATVNVIPTNVGVTTYTVVAFNGSCQGNPATIDVTVNPAAVASAGSDVTTTYTGSMSGLVNFDNSGSLGTSYSWDFGDGNSSGQASPSHNYTAPGTYTVILTATLGNCVDSDTLTIVVMDDVGINEVSFGDGVNIYPNPAKDVIFLGFDLSEPKDVQIRVVDAIGKLVTSTTWNSVYKNTFELDLSSAARGVYFVTITSGEEQITKRITLMK